MLCSNASSVDLDTITEQPSLLAATMTDDPEPNTKPEDQNVSPVSVANAAKLEKKADDKVKDTTSNTTRIRNDEKQIESDHSIFHSVFQACYTPAVVLDEEKVKVKVNAEVKEVEAEIKEVEAKMTEEENKEEMEVALAKSAKFMKQMVVNEERSRTSEKIMKKLISGWAIMEKACPDWYVHCCCLC